MENMNILHIVIAEQFEFRAIFINTIRTVFLKGYVQNLYQFKGPFLYNLVVYKLRMYLIIEFNKGMSPHCTMRYFSILFLIMFKMKEAIDVFVLI